MIMNHSLGAASSPDSTVGVNNWEDLRRRARQCESELDSKLFTFSKLLTTTRNEYQRSGGSASNRSYEAEPLIGAQDNFDRLRCEIETLLETLRDANGSMAQHCASTSANAIAQHTLQRHQEILKDYVNEFHKTCANIEEQINRDRLLEPHRNDLVDIRFSPTNRKQPNEFAMKENDSIRSSEIMIDDQIQIAMRTRDTLRSQRSTMKSIQTQLTTLANKFPMLNNVMHRIGVKKRKDSLILAIVIGVCLFLLLLYIF